MRLLFPLIVTVGHIVRSTNSWMVGVLLWNSGLRLQQFDVGVPQSSGDPDSLALVSRSNVASGQHVPESIIPDRGQVPENESQSP